MHILVVAHNDVNRLLFHKICERLGCTVATAENGHDALDYLSGPSQRPDLIFMDVLMPIMSGSEVAHILRNRPPFTTDVKLRNTPIIGLYADGIGPVSEAQRLGFNDFIPKPFKYDYLRSQLRFWTRKEIIPPGSGLGGRPDLLRGMRRGHWGPRSRM